MSLRTTSDESPRLTPEEARAFLQIHAEREEGRHEVAPDAPTVESMAELLHLSPEETRSILAEARSRATVPVVEPKRTVRREGLWAAGALGMALLLAGISLVSFRTAPAAPQIAIAAEAPVVQAIKVAEAAPALGPPDGWQIDIEAAGYNVSRSGEPATFGTDFRRLSAPETVALRQRLVDATLDVLKEVKPGSPWAEARTISVGYRVIGGQWTRLIVPVKPFTLPFAGNPEGRADLRKMLDRTIDAGWDSIMKAVPQ